tara:strand:+ start:1430 stop:1873 length:444 start_codon:yes stop_codon:yes gene_type:complete
MRKFKRVIGDSMSMKYWKCLAEGCGDDVTYHHKGLCRSCTEYSESGEVLNAVSRVRVTESGTPYEKHEHHRHKVSKANFLDARRRKMTNKERAYITEQYELAHAVPHVHDENCGHDIEPDQQIMEIGESLTDAEQTFDNIVEQKGDA